jgi:hypothetical protein
MLSEFDAVCELRDIVAGLDLPRTVFRANHTSNPVPLAGRFPQDKNRMIDELNFLLASNRLDVSGPGHLPLPGLL